MSGEPINRRVRVIYDVDTDQAVEGQSELDQALGRTNEALDQQATSAGNAERAHGSMADVATRSEQVQARLHQQLQALAGGLGTLASVIGTDTEAGAVVGRMAQMTSMGLQLGSMLGPQGAIAGGILGTAVPAIGALFDALTPVVPAIRDVTDEATSNTSAIIAMGDAYAGAGDRMRDFLSQVSTAGRTAGLQDLNAQITELADDIERVGRAGSAMERLDLPGMRDRLAGMMAQSSGIAETLDDERGELGRNRRRSGGARRPTDTLGALARGAGRDDAIGFALGLEGEGLMPGEGEIAAARRRGTAAGVGRGLGREDAEGLRLRSLERQKTLLEEIQEKQNERHRTSMEQLERETGMVKQLGSTLYDAFVLAVSGQEDFGTAVVKGFKLQAIEFGGQMVNEGLGALLTAAGNVVANPPLAATKAGEGAGKIALGVGLGAVGAAIPVPSSGATQARPPRLGPASNDGQYGGSVTVHMNAPAVMTGTQWEVGREIARALDGSRRRFGRAA